MKVLVTGAGSVLGQAIIKSLKAITKFNIEIHAVDPMPNAVGLFLADEQHWIPYVKETSYMSEFKRLLKSIKPEFVLIGTDTELYAISAEKELLEKEFNTIIIVSSTEIIKMADDKYSTYHYLKSIGFDAPETYLPNEKIDLEKLNYPLILKPRIGARSIGVQLIQSSKSLEFQLAMQKNQIIQEYLSSSKEYTAGVIYFNEQNIASIVMERTLKDGNTFTAIPLNYSWINESLESLAKKIKPFGPINFQFKIENSKIFIFEINARFSGTTYFRTIANFNEVEMVIAFLKNKQEIIQPQINTSIQILRYYDELVVTRSN